VRRVQERRANLESLHEELASTVRLQENFIQQIINIKCAAFGLNRTILADREASTAVNLLGEFGPGKLVEWYSSAAAHGVEERNAIRYVCGCARRTRAKE
jgi:hypothetical protein